MTELFDGDLNDPSETPVEPAGGSYFEALVGEDKPFKTNEDLAKGKAESDRFIQQLQKELSGLRAELKTRTTLEEFMDTMKESNPKELRDSTGQGTPSHEPPVREPSSNTEKYTEEDFRKMIEEYVGEKTQAERAEANLAEVKRTLAAVYGPDYQRILKDKAASLEVGPDFLTDMAKSKPKALYGLLGIDATKLERAARERDSISPPASSQVSHIQKPDVGRKTYGDFQRLLKESPNEYWTPRVQNEMYRLAKEAAERGESFSDTP